MFLHGAIPGIVDRSIVDTSIVDFCHVDFCHVDAGLCGQS